MRHFVFAAITLTLASPLVAAAQAVQVYQTTPDLLEALSQRETLRFAANSKSNVDLSVPSITVSDDQRFQEIDGFGASLTDAAAWLIDKKLTPAQANEAFQSLFSRKDGIAINMLRQPVGSSDLSATFYSFDDLCQQEKKACTTPSDASGAMQSDVALSHFSLAHDEAYIQPQLRKALAINPGIKIMLTPWSAPGWMKTTGSMLGSVGDEQHPSSLKPEFYPAYAQYLVKAVNGYQAAGVPVWGMSVENEPLYAPPTYSGMHMTAEEQAKFFGEALGPALAAANLHPKVMAYDHNWDRPDYPETVLRDAKAGELAAGAAWHHYGGDPAVMSQFHDRFPQKDQWVTESSGGTWQKGYKDKGNVLAQEAAELIAVMRNWSRSYILWALATDQNHGPFVGGCDVCRGLITINTENAAEPVKRELDYYVLGHASKFLLPGAVRIASDEPPAGELHDVAFLNPDGTVVLYALNADTTSHLLRIGFHNRSLSTTIPAGSVATFIWKR